jgi:prophage regulatory protein
MKYKLLSLDEVIAMTGMSRSMIYLNAAKGEFPRQVQLCGRRVMWVEAEIQKWIKQMMDKREA